MPPPFRVALSDDEQDLGKTPLDTDDSADQDSNETSAEEPAPAVPEPVLLNELRTDYFRYMYATYAPWEPMATCEHPDCPYAGIHNPTQALFRCRECLGGRMVCYPCLEKSHRLLPFHRVDQWIRKQNEHKEDVGYFEEVELRALGFVLGLGHNGGICTTAGRFSRVPDLITVMHPNGIRKVRVRYCSCPSNGDLPWQQLLDHGLIPATHDRPNTAFTFDVLEQFQHLNLTSKVSAYDFVQSSRLNSDPVMPDSVPVSSF